MKKITLFLMVLVAMLVAIPMFAQDRNNEDEVIKVDPRQRDYREGEVLVSDGTGGSSQCTAKMECTAAHF